MIRTIVIALLFVSVAVFIWYFVTNHESFSPCINCHLKTQKNEQVDETFENETFENEIPEEKRTLLDFDDFREDYKPPDKELDSILKGPEEQKSFISSQHFTGQRDGYVFKNGRHGNGYYLDRHVQFNL
jgi:hypothetical protein